MSADDDRLLSTGMRVGLYFGCDTPDHMADEILSLRAEVARLRSLIDRSNLEETDGYEAQGPRLVKADRILVSKDIVAQEQRIIEALQTAAKYARKTLKFQQAIHDVLLMEMSNKAFKLSDIFDRLNTVINEERETPTA